MGTAYVQAFPHDPIERLFDDVYWVHGSFKVAPGIGINRNMVVLRHDGDLTLLNPLRLDDEGERALGELGDVKHIVRIGYFHGCDDPYYVDRHGAKLWAQQGSDLFPDGPKPDEILQRGGAFPVPDSEVFLFHDTNKPECAILHRPNGGLLVTCDAVQHHVDMSNCTFLARGVLRVMGFMRPMNIGPPWRKRMTPQGGSLKADFDRLLELDFDHAVGAHGSVCRGGANAELEATVRDVYG